MSTKIELSYGPVYVTKGAFKGQIMDYDDDEGRQAICYIGSIVSSDRYYLVPKRYLREPLVDDLLTRLSSIDDILYRAKLRDEWHLEIDELHELWLEKNTIKDALFARRKYGELPHIEGDKTIFLCHSSADKGFVRMVHDDLRQMGINTWLDENIIKVGESIVGKVSEGIAGSQFMAVFRMF